MSARVWRKGNPPTLLVGMSVSSTIVESSMEDSPPKKEQIPSDPEIPLLGIYPKSAGAQFERDRCTPMLIAALFTIPKKWKKPKCPSGDEWINAPASGEFNKGSRGS